MKETIFHRNDASLSKPGDARDYDSLITKNNGEMGQDFPEKGDQDLPQDLSMQCIHSEPGSSGIEIPNNANSCHMTTRSRKRQRKSLLDGRDHNEVEFGAVANGQLVNKSSFSSHSAQVHPEASLPQLPTVTSSPWFCSLPSLMLSPALMLCQASFFLAASQYQALQHYNSLETSRQIEPTVTEQHDNSKMKQSFTCNRCSMGFTHHSNATEHMKQQHPQFSNQSQNRDNDSYEKDELPLNEEYVGACTSSQPTNILSGDSNLFNVQRAKADVQLLTCDTQQGGSDSSTSKKMACFHCGARFSTASSLNRHILNHSGRKQYECSHCPSRFLTKSGHKRHEKRMHTTQNIDVNMNPSDSPGQLNSLSDCKIEKSSEI